MGKSKNRSLKLGLLVAVGLVLFSVGVYFLGTKQNLFSSSVTIKSYFKNVKGLVEGNKVQYSGITVGYVSEIKIANDTTILVEMSVNKNVQDFIRTDSKVEINSDGLMGSKLVSIYPGSEDAASIGDDEFLKSQQSIDLQDVVEEAKVVITDVQKITRSLLEISDKINNGNGDLAVLLNENTITSKLNQAGDELLNITANANEVVQKINHGEGDLGRLINDTVVTDQAQELMVNLDSISVTTAQVADELLKFSKQLNSGDGVIQRLVYDTKMANDLDTTIAKVSEGVDDVAGAARTLENSWIFNLFSKNKK